MKLILEMGGEMGRDLNQLHREDEGALLAGTESKLDRACLFSFLQPSSPSLVPPTGTPNQSQQARELFCQVESQFQHYKAGESGFGAEKQLHSPLPLVVRTQQWFTPP